MRLQLMILCLWAISVQAQEAVFIGKQGEELQELLVSEFRPGTLMDYGPARDTMYLNVYRDGNGEVECYYTGLRTFLPLGVDPSSFLYKDGDDLGITAEHIYPQSKGASELPSRSDMHSLVPSIWRANEARSNYPFGEVPDDETDHWYGQDEDLIEEPLTDKSAYSERLNGGWGNPGLFEPRESVKGDIARAVFYFHTIYRSEAEQADPDFFDKMKEALYYWHIQDPVDDVEKLRNELKAKYQNGKLNPFILDCSLARRTYFENLDSINEDCPDEQNTSVINDDRPNFIVAPNPVNEVLKVMTASDNGYTLSIGDLYGVSFYESNQRGPSEIEVGNLAPGIYLVNLKADSGQEESYRIVKF